MEQQAHKEPDTAPVRQVRTVNEVAVILDCDHRYVRKLIDQGVLEILPHTSHKKILVSSIERLLAGDAA